MTSHSDCQHPLRNIPVEPWMFKRAREQAELLMQIAVNTAPPIPQVKAAMEKNNVR